MLLGKKVVSLGVEESYSYVLFGLVDGSCYFYDLRQILTENPSKVLLSNRNCWMAAEHRINFCFLSSKLEQVQNSFSAFTSSVGTKVVWWQLLYSGEGHASFKAVKLAVFAANSNYTLPGQVISMCVCKTSCEALVFGDIRGKIHVCNLKQDPDADSENDLLSDAILEDVHGSDKVSCLVTYNDRIYSG